MWLEIFYVFAFASSLSLSLFLFKVLTHRNRDEIYNAFWQLLKTSLTPLNQKGYYISRRADVISSLITATNNKTHNNKPKSFKLGLFISSPIMYSYIFKGDKYRSKKGTDSIVGVMLLDKSIRSRKVQFFIFLCMIINLFFSIHPSIDVSSFLITLSFSFLILIEADQWLIAYRISKGFYGYNGFESREIVSFIINHSSKDDFTGSGGFKKIHPIQNPQANKEVNDQPQSGGATI